MNIYAIHAIDLQTFMKTEEPILNFKKSSAEDVYSSIGTYGLHLYYYDI